MSDLPDSYLPATSLPTKACANEETVKILRRGFQRPAGSKVGRIQA
jgi:hypothetical protein